MSIEYNIPQTNNKRIAKNTLMLYIRMMFGMMVSLYTSRVVLNTLGVEDYGIYNVVGGLVAMMGILNNSMSGATSRFLTYALGKGDAEDIKITFSSALIIHIFIALLVFITAETLGLWFLNNKLVLPESRMYAAQVVFHLSVLSSMLGIIQVPYNSCIVAHERMGIYAYVEILNVSLKLIVVYLLLCLNYDHLILYAILLFMVSVLISSCYIKYCQRNFSEARFRWVWDKKKIKPMLSFSGWDLYGNASVMLRQQGVSMILNMFIGPIVNTASGIAGTVNTVIMSFIHNVLMAIRPPIIKCYASGNFADMFSMMNWAAKICTTLMLMLTIPLLSETYFVLKIWLSIVPDYVVAFCRILLITSCFTTITSVINIGIHATGRIHLISFVSGTIIWLAVPVIYLLLSNGYHPNYAYYCNGLVSAIVVWVNLFIIKHNLPQFSISVFLREGVFRSIIIGLFIAISIYYIHSTMLIGWYRLLLTIIVSILEGLCLAYFFLLSKSERNTVCERIKKRLW